MGGGSLEVVKLLRSGSIVDVVLRRCRPPSAPDLSQPVISGSLAYLVLNLLKSLLLGSDSLLSLQVVLVLHGDVLFVSFGDIVRVRSASLQHEPRIEWRGSPLPTSALGSGQHRAHAEAGSTWQPACARSRQPWREP